MFGIFNIKFLSKRYILLSVFGLISCLFTVNIICAKNNSTKTKTPINNVHKEVIQDNLSTQQGLEVHIDPDTGELISPPEEGELQVQPNNAVINNAPDNATEEQTVIIENPDGSKTFIYPDSHQFTNKIKIDESGKVVSECGRENEK